jgi:vesicle coat complex subunit
MAESLGNMKFLSTYSLDKDGFQEVYFDELIELVSDSDNMVKIKAFEAVAKLIHSENRESYLDEKQVEEEIMPALIKLTETVLEDEDGMQLMSNRYGLIVNSISQKF